MNIILYIVCAVLCYIGYVFYQIKYAYHFGPADLAGELLLGLMICAIWPIMLCVAILFLIFKQIAIFLWRFK